MYKPTGFAEQIFKLRYAFTPEESWEEACKRVAYHVSRAEIPEKQKENNDLFFKVLSENLFMPGGRIWYGCGRNKSNLLNCFVVPIDDSREGWGKLIMDDIVISGMGGGIGTNFSPVRPRGAEIKGTGGVASGAVSVMKIVDKVGEEIKGGGNRRGAFLFGLRYDHPDILEFLDVKLNLKALNNANISVLIDNKFLDLVESDGEVELTFGNKIYGKYNAREFFDKLIENNVRSGEPGILNMGYANETNNIYYEKNLIITNPCGELPLAPYQSCCLGSLVLPRFVDDKGNVDWQELAETITIGTRFLDNVLDVTSYPIVEIETETKKYRRIGVGVIGLHDMLLKMGLKYTSDEGIEFIDKLMNFIKKKSYEASTYLAAEKGSFPSFKKEEYLRSEFIKSMSPSIKTRIKQHGIRNSALNTMPPTGSTGIVCGFSGGIEPLFSYAYVRTWRDNDGEKSEVVIHPLFEEFVNSGKDVSHFQSAHEITPEEHIRVQVTCQKHIDGAISKTINLPSTYTGEDLKPILLQYLRTLKGITVYRDGSRGKSPLVPMSIEEAKQWISKNHITASKERNCVGDRCEL